MSDITLNVKCSECNGPLVFRGELWKEGPHLVVAETFCDACSNTQAIHVKLPIRTPVDGGVKKLREAASKALLHMRHYLCSRELSGFVEPCDCGYDKARAELIAALTTAAPVDAPSDKDIREKWAEIVKLNRPPGCVIDSGMFAIELVKWALDAAALRPAADPQVISRVNFTTHETELIVTPSPDTEADADAPAYGYRMLRSTRPIPEPNPDVIQEGDEYYIDHEWHLSKDHMIGRMPDGSLPYRRRMRENEMTTQLDLEAIEKRANAATVGPWEYSIRDAVLYTDTPQGILPWQGIWAPNYGPSVADGNFIAHARTDIPALIAEVKRLRAAPPASPQPQAGRQVTSDKGE